MVGRFAEPPISATTKSFLFLLFLFGIGYSVGPQFLQALAGRVEARAAVALVSAFSRARCWPWPSPAICISIRASRPGSCPVRSPESPAMGTATEAINALAIPEADRARFVAHIAVADAVCYIFGTAA